MSSNTRSLADVKRIVESTNYASPGSVREVCNTFSRWLHANKCVLPL